jgi:hypothetical protein
MDALRPSALVQSERSKPVPQIFITDIRDTGMVMEDVLPS